MQRLFAISALVAATACGSGTATSPTTAAETLELRLQTDRFRPAFATRPAGAFLTLQQLNADPNAGRQVYEVGYLLGEFIVSAWGRPAYLHLIQANGDLQSLLGLSPAAFESSWQAFVRQRYLS